MAHSSAEIDEDARERSRDREGAGVFKERTFLPRIFILAYRYAWISSVGLYPLIYQFHVRTSLFGFRRPIGFVHWNSSLLRLLATP